ncbi:hypothetical protein ALC57_05121 [Trachymyrmex cornetzi]|uniref:Mutator-like transposase domain-containing protein n=1 Tax=Trachymyrmex cornetzi TaxID=471704 RepID=A0A151JBW0_9HYME|nr:hypothetical protein ALC57_05121 [Trachymyrmex cornetzi]
MEIDVIKEMFSRSEEKFGVKYITYIGDGDSKTFKAILNLNCLGGHNQNNNECLNSMIWHLAPKHLHTGSKTIESCAYLAAGIFNEILKVMETMGIIIDQQCKMFADCADERRLARAEIKIAQATKKSPIADQSNIEEANEFFEEADDLFYGPGIAD